MRSARTGARSQVDFSEIAVMFDTQFPWQPAVLVYLTYICAVCTQTRSSHLLLTLCAEAGGDFELLVNESIRDDKNKQWPPLSSFL